MSKLNWEAYDSHYKPSEIKIDVEIEDGVICLREEVFEKIRRDYFDTRDKALREALITLGWTPPGQGQPSAEPVAWMTHHDEPMLFPSESEAASYCGDGEEPVALIRLSDYEALQAECEKLHQEVEALQGIQPEMPPMPPNGKGLPRYGVRWNGPSQPLSVPMDDGYWTPWHLAHGECETLHKAIRRLCNIYVVDDYYMGQLREDRLDEAVNRAIEQVKETTK